MKESRKLDQFYTKPEIAKKYYELLMKKYELNNYLLIEPSAGNGSFSDLFHLKSISLDLSPKKEYIKKQDFFKFKISKKQRKENKIFTIGNPPFGKNASLALKFLNKSAEYSDYIAFVLPKTFKKESMQNKINQYFHLDYEEDLLDKSFIHDNEEYDVPCVFQVWKKKEEKRLIEKSKTTSDLFDFCEKKNADFAIRRVGVLSGKVLLEYDKYKKSSHYYIKIKSDLIKTEDFISSFNSFQEVAKNTAGNPSLSKGELIKIIENKKRS